VLVLDRGDNAECTISITDINNDQLPISRIEAATVLQQKLTRSLDTFFLHVWYRWVHVHVRVRVHVLADLTTPTNQ
jgi:hypothetical protein